MCDSVDKTQQRHSTIRDLLRTEWDPIGVGHYAEARHEYDGYVAQLDALVARSASPQDIFTELWRIETEIMGLPGDRQKTEAIARRLSALA
jgi:hypothetical protein